MLLVRVKTGTSERASRAYRLYLKNTIYRFLAILKATTQVNIDNKGGLDIPCYAYGRYLIIQISFSANHESQGKDLRNDYADTQPPIAYK